MTSQYIFYRDMERNPYSLGTPENAEWSAKDDKRLEEISKAREDTHIKAKQYLSHEDEVVRQMAHLICWFFERD